MQRFESTRPNRPASQSLTHTESGSVALMGFVTVVPSGRDAPLALRSKTMADVRFSPKPDYAPTLVGGAKVPISDICGAANCGLSNGQEIPGLRNMEQAVQVRTGLRNFTDCLHDIVCYKIRSLWIR
jgi:hypothetical protein